MKVVAYLLSIYYKKENAVRALLTGFLINDLLKTPNSTHSVCVVLIVVVLGTIVEVLFPCVVIVVLAGTPIVGTYKSNRKLE